MWRSLDKPAPGMGTLLSVCVALILLLFLFLFGVAAALQVVARSLATPGIPLHVPAVPCKKGLHTEMFQAASPQGSPLGEYPYVVTQPFGPTPYTAEPVIGGVHFHTGIDLAAPPGTPIYATMCGIVAFAVDGCGIGYAGNLCGGGFGNRVVVGNGHITEFCGHQEAINPLYATPGQEIDRGELVGYVGSSGSSTGPHCHYEIDSDGGFFQGGSAIDPAPTL